ncbi:MAG: hypothetical protein PUE61_00875 [Clostridiales bacterium]|nr:hypothetical protein [Clostridiales bacterium]
MKKKGPLSLFQRKPALDISDCFSISLNASEAKIHRSFHSISKFPSSFLGGGAWEPFSETNPEGL